MLKKNKNDVMHRHQHATVSFEDVLVLADGTSAAANALDYAQYLSPDGNIAALMLSVMPAYFVGEMNGEAWIVAQRQAEREAEAAELAFKEKLLRQGSRAEVLRANVLFDDAGSVMARHARYMDGAILGWPDSRDDRPVAEFEGVLFDSGRPALIVPEQWSHRGRPRSIMVAWSASREASRAVHDALPLLATADAVRIVVVADDQAEREQNPGDDMARHLARHDIRVEVKHVPSAGNAVSEILLDEARFQGADLIVMGGYSHSRTGEWLMGGVTREILTKPTVPLMMSH